MTELNDNMIEMILTEADPVPPPAVNLPGMKWRRMAQFAGGGLPGCLGAIFYEVPQTAKLPDPAELVTCLTLEVTQTLDEEVEKGNVSADKMVDGKVCYGEVAVTYVWCGEEFTTRCMYVIIGAEQVDAEYDRRANLAPVSGTKH